jgi:hypothetical protein
MHCLYCKKRLWLFFSKDRQFCSALHEAAYHDELSAMNRLLEFKDPEERPALPAPRNRTLSEIYRASVTPPIPPVVPPLCSFAGELGRANPVIPDPAGNLLLGNIPFAGQIQFPSSRSLLIAFTLDSVNEPAGEIASTANQLLTVCRVHTKRSRRVAPRSPAAFSSRTHRRRVR